MIPNIIEQAAGMEGELIAWRRDLHRIPEISYALPQTANYLEEKLRSFGITKLRTGICGYGITADIDGCEPGKTIALRSDMDALPVVESTGCGFTSTQEGQMHACGHDGHMAMLLGAAKILSENRNSFKGTVRLIFQPAEEGPPPGGSHGMIGAGVLEGVYAIYGIHLSPLEPTGQVAFNMTTAMSALDCFTIELVGKGGHGSMPQKSIDAITLSAQVINNLQHIVSRQSDPLEPLVITIGTINGGFMWNIIAETVTMTGTMRSYSQPARFKALEDIERCIRSACDGVGASYNFKNEPAVNPLINNLSATQLLRDTLTELLGEDRVKLMQRPSTASEDFSNYLFQIPGSFLWLGCCTDESTAYPLHHPKFSMDETALKTGTAIHVAMASRYLAGDVTLKMDSTTG